MGAVDKMIMTKRELKEYLTYEREKYDGLGG